MCVCVGGGGGGGIPTPSLAGLLFTMGDMGYESSQT